MLSFWGLSNLFVNNILLPHINHTDTEFVGYKIIFTILRDTLVLRMGHFWVRDILDLPYIRYFVIYQIPLYQVPLYGNELCDENRCSYSFYLILFRAEFWGLDGFRGKCSEAKTGKLQSILKNTFLSPHPTFLIWHPPPPKKKKTRRRRRRRSSPPLLHSLPQVLPVGLNIYAIY